MTDKSIDTLLTSIEKECADELDCVLFFDLEHYSTAYLHELRQKCEHRQVMLQNTFRQIFWIGATAPLWLGIAVYITFQFPEWRLLLLFTVSCFVVTLFLFVFGMYKLRSKFGGKHKQNYIVRLIETEINRREWDNSKSIWTR